MITRLGGGSFADVYKAREKSTGELVAIKILKKKYKKWEECIELRECKSLQILNKTLSNEKGKDNIIKLKRIIFINKTGVLNLVFEFMEKDLLVLMKSYEPKRLPENKIKDIIYQTLLGLAYMHKYGFFHRDLKPENLLLVDDKVKIADFGLAREIRSIPPYTEYVSTRYYRAPECILKSTNYNSPIDIWALGCVMAEMYLHPQPLFYGANEKEVLFRICSILGTPTYDIWSDGIQQANYIGFKFPNSNKIELEKVIPNASEDAIDVLKQMLRWDPNHRATAANLLNHKFFDNCQIYPKISNSSTNSNIDFNFDNCKSFYDNNRNSQNKNNKNIDNNKLNEYKDKNDINYGLNDNGFMLNKENENKNEDNNFSKMLNDTDGFNKLLNQLKQEKINEDKDFEKQKKDNNFNNLFISIEQKLGLSNFESRNFEHKFNENKEKEIEEEEEIEKEKEIELEKEKEKEKPIKPNYNINKEKRFSFLDEYKFNEINNNNKYENNDNDNDRNNINKKNTFDLRFNNKFNNNNLINKDNNDELGFENAKRLKPLVNNNRRGSARKFLEENENKIDKFPTINNNNNNNDNCDRKLKYNFSNNLLGDFEKREYKKPTIIKKDFSFADNLNGIFEKQNKKIEIHNYNGFKKRDFNYGKNISLTNNNISSGYYLNKKNDNYYDKNNNLRRGPSYYENGNMWDL